MRLTAGCRPTVLLTLRFAALLIGASSTGGVAAALEGAVQGTRRNPARGRPTTVPRMIGL